MRNDKQGNMIVEKSFAFALEIIDFAEGLIELRKYKMSDQLFKSGTSIGANIKEAQNAESRKDFIHKMKIAVKEADETEYWLCLINASPKYPSNEVLLNEVRQIIRILSKIISTSKLSESN